MSDFRRDRGPTDGRGEDDMKWITTDNGVHVPIKEGETKAAAIKRHFGEQSKKQVAVGQLIDTLKKVKKIKTTELINYIKSFAPIELKTKDKDILAQFDIHSAKENIFGDKFSDIEGYEFKINNIDKLPSYIRDSKYSHTSQESGKKIKTHKDVREWHYFTNKIQSDRGELLVNVNIRDKGNSQFVYLVTFRKTKKPRG